MGQDTFVSSGDDPLERRIGQVIGGKWTLESLLGSGGMAAVYAARHSIGKRHAIKILHPHVARQAEARARFDQEAMAANRVTGAVQVFDGGTTDDGCPFLVMDLLVGETLAERLKRVGQLPQTEAVDLVDRLLEIIGEAHAASILHRDIKPDNVFLAEDGAIMVLDFGIARVRGSIMQVATQTGVTLGTPAYMSQEQIKGIDVDERTDVFAIGAVLFLLLGGRTVHVAETEQLLIMKMLTQPAPPLASVAPDVPAPLCQVVDRAVAFDKAERYPDTTTMRSDLAAARSGAPPPHAAALPPPAGFDLSGASAAAGQAAPVAVPATTVGMTAAASTRRGERNRGALLIALIVGGVLLGVMAVIAFAGLGGDHTGEEDPATAREPDGREGRDGPVGRPAPLWPFGQGGSGGDGGGDGAATEGAGGAGGEGATSSAGAGGDVGSGGGGSGGSGAEGGGSATNTGPPPVTDKPPPTNEKEKEKEKEKKEKELEKEKKEKEKELEKEKKEKEKEKKKEEKEKKKDAKKDAKNKKKDDDD